MEITQNQASEMVAANADNARRALSAVHGLDPSAAVCALITAATAIIDVSYSDPRDKALALGDATQTTIESWTVLRPDTALQ